MKKENLILRFDLKDLIAKKFAIEDGDNMFIKEGDCCYESKRPCPPNTDIKILSYELSESEISVCIKPMGRKYGVEFICKGDPVVVKLDPTEIFVYTAILLCKKEGKTLMRADFNRNPQAKDGIMVWFRNLYKEMKLDFEFVQKMESLQYNDLHGLNLRISSIRRKLRKAFSGSKNGFDLCTIQTVKGQYKIDIPATNIKLQSR